MASKTPSSFKKNIHIQQQGTSCRKQDALQEKKMASELRKKPLSFSIILVGY